MFDIGASESHHHSYRWGLLEHTLDTIQKALKSLNEKPIKILDREGYPLQTSSKKSAPLNQMTVFAACLLHDIGKVNTLKIWPQDKRRKQDIWNPSVHGLHSYLKNLNIDQYKYTWVENRGGGHEKFNALYVSKVLGDDFLSALGKEKTELLIDAISPSKSHDNPIGRYVTDADMLSVQEYINSIKDDSAQLNTDNNAPPRNPETQAKETSNQAAPQQLANEEALRQQEADTVRVGEVEQEPPQKPQVLSSKESVSRTVEQQAAISEADERPIKASATEPKWISQFFDSLKTQVKRGALSFVEDSKENQTLVKKIVFTKRAIAINVNDYRNILLECGFNTTNAESVKKANFDLMQAGVAAAKEGSANPVFNVVLKTDKKVRAKAILLHPRCKLRFIPKGTPCAKNIEIDFESMIFAQAPSETQPASANRRRPSPLDEGAIVSQHKHGPPINNKQPQKAVDVRSALVLATGAWKESDKDKLHKAAEIIEHIKAAAGDQVDPQIVYNHLLKLKAIASSQEGDKVSFGKMKEIHRKLKSMPK